MPCRKLSYKVKFDLFDKKQRFRGLKRILFHASLYDPTQGMREKLTYSMFREMGVPAPRQAWGDVRLVIKSQEFSTEYILGLHLITESIDSDFTKASFPGGEGNLYKEAWPGMDSRASYVAALRTNKKKAAVARMLEFSEKLNNATDDFELVEVVEDFMDVEAVASYLAVDRAGNNWDGPLSFRKSQTAGEDGFYNHSESQISREGGHMPLVGVHTLYYYTRSLCTVLLLSQQTTSSTRTTQRRRRGEPSSSSSHGMWRGLGATGLVLYTWHAAQDMAVIYATPQARVLLRLTAKLVQ